MKTKLNLTIDADVVDKFKRYAKQKRQSMSSLIEEHVREITNTSQRKFSQRWTGKLSLSGKDDPRYKALVKKYS